MKHKVFKPAALLLFILTGITNTVCFGQLFCRREFIEGFKREHDIGVKLHGNNTSKIAESKLYLTVKDDLLYVQSNYLPDETSPYPVKLATPVQEGLSVEDYLGNMYYSEKTVPLTSKEANLFIHHLRNDIEITVDPSVFNSADFNDFDFSKFNKVKIACPDEVARSVIKFPHKNGTVEYLVKYSDNISVRLKDQNLNFIFTNLKAQRINQNELKIISLLENSTTKTYISSNFPGKAIPFNYSDIAGFKALLLENKANRTIILGHIEGGSFVTLDKGGKELFKISIEEIQAFQKENKLSLIILGCNSAESGVPGAANKFNSIDALKRLKTTEKVENAESFLDSLAFRTIHFVLDATFFRTEESLTTASVNFYPERIDFDVYARTETTIKSVKGRPLGKIIFLGIDDFNLTGNEEVSPAPALQTSSTADQEAGDDDNNNDDGEDNTILYIIFGIGIILVGRQIFKSLN